MSNEQSITISAAQLMAEIEQAALKRERALVLGALCKTGNLDDAMAELRNTRTEHMRLVAELAGMTAREDGR